MPCNPRYTTLAGSAKLVFSAIFWPFSWVITHDFRVSEGISMWCDPRYTILKRSAKLVFSAISGRFFVGYNP